MMKVLLVNFFILIFDIHLLTTIIDQINLFSTLDSEFWPLDRMPVLVSVEQRVYAKQPAGSNSSLLM